MSFPPVYVGNYQYEADERDLEDTFAKYGPVTSVEYKRGFCFVYFENKDDAEECIRALDGRDYQGRRLRVEFAKNDANVRAREATRRADAEPNTALFVAGFDPRDTVEEDIKKAFEAFGQINRCEKKKTFAFVEYENVEDAKDACTNMHNKKINGREITVEYVVKKEGRDRERGGGGGGGGRDRRGGHGGGGGGHRGDRGGDRYRRDDRDGRDRDGGRRDDFRGRRDDDRGRGGHRGDDRGRRDDDRGRRDDGRGRRDDDRGRRDDRGGARGRGGRSRSRSYERRRPKSFSRSRSPVARRGRSPPPRKAPPPSRRDRSRSPYRSPGANGQLDVYTYGAD